MNSEEPKNNINPGQGTPVNEDSNDGISTPGVTKKVSSIRKALNCLLDLEKEKKRNKRKKQTQEKV